MKKAMEEVQAADVTTWDMHATATPGDATEIENSLEMLHPDVIFTARKGTFGHGMSAGGGWELTAQYLGYSAGKMYPTPLAARELNKQISQVHGRFVYDREEPAPAGCAGKLSMGVGGINACVISRPWK
jgi:3-oxoacyl-(acyl-carrier-protein) synthase